MRQIVSNIFIFNHINNELYLLIVQRGKGAKCANYKWTVPGGHLEDNETIEQCVIRETFEETSLKIDNVTLHSINSDVNNKNNPNNIIGINYIKFLWDDIQKISIDNCEPNELQNIKWIRITDINKYDWAFPQQFDIITNIINRYF